MEYRDAVFLITKEESCPIYNKGEELLVHEGALTVDFEKPACLTLVSKIQEALSKDKGKQRFTQRTVTAAHTSFICDGCGSLSKITFEYKQAKAFSTLQMNMLRLAEKKKKKKFVEALVGVLAKIEVFEHLEKRDLFDLAFFLEPKQVLPHKVLVKEGDRGRFIYIMLHGHSTVLNTNNEVVEELKAGDIFGEMSLLSGEPATASIHTQCTCKFVTLNGKDLKVILNKFPVLQLFFYRLLVNRAQVNLLRAGKISSGMSGELIDINAVELFQLINAGGKSGRVDFNFSDGRGFVLFEDGEIVDAAYKGIEGKEAIFGLLSLTKGSFVYKTGIDDVDKNGEVVGGFMGLLMEGLRRIDELAEGD